MEDTNNPFAAPQSFEEASSSLDPYTESQLAGRGVRFAAWIVDGLIFAAVYLPIFWLVLFVCYPRAFDVSMIKPGMTQAEIEAAMAPNQPPEWFGYAMTPVGYCIYLLLNGYLLATNGQTIAKRMLGIKVVCVDGSPASLGRLFGLRYVVMSLLYFGPRIVWALPMLIDPLMIFRESRRCLHDEIACTIVINA